MSTDLGKLSMLSGLISAKTLFYEECGWKPTRKDYGELLEHANDLLDITEDLRGITEMSRSRVKNYCSTLM